MEPQTSEWETAPVLLCGSRPVGELFSLLLAGLSVKNIVLDGEVTIPTDPGAFSRGEDGVRPLQAVGLYLHINTEIGAERAWASFIGGKHTDFHHPLFLEMNAEKNWYTGHVLSIMFKYPRMEKHLQGAIEANEYTELRVGYATTSIEQDVEWVYEKYEDGRTGKCCAQQTGIVVIDVEALLD